MHPSRYGAVPGAAAEPYDQRRDALTFALLEKDLAARLPILCICRGFQEAAVYFGSTLHPRVHEVAGLMDHRRPDVPDLAGQFALNHPVQVHAGQWADWLAAKGIWPADRRVMINSLHWQGIDKLGDDLQIEAKAPDGLVEAFSAPINQGFSGLGNFTLNGMPPRPPISCDF